MNEIAIKRNLRREFGKIGFALLIYFGIMNVTVMIVSFSDMFSVVLKNMLTGGSQEELDAAMEAVLSNGWGYILAILIGCVAMYLWKKKEFCVHTIWKSNNPMKTGSFFALLCLFVSGQALFQLLAMVMEGIFNLLGMSVMESIEAASTTGDTLSMFLYITLFAPIFEEVFFRGLILRSLEPYGKKFSIFASAFLFGIFHGNIVQSPYAFGVGLILGYVAVEYSVGWAMVLHMINNLVLGDSFGRLVRCLPVWQGDLLFFVIVWGCTIAAAAILMIKRKQVAAYFKEKKIHPLCMKSFFTSPGILAITVVMAVNILLTLMLQFAV